MGESLSSDRRIAKNTLMLYFRMGVTMIVSLYTARIVLSTLGEVNYGIMNVVSGCVAIFTFLNGAMSGSASRFFTFELGRKDKVKLKKTFNASVMVHILLAMFVTILAETVGLWLLENKLIIPADRMYAARWAYQLSLVMIIISLVQIPYGAAIVAHEKMSAFAWMSIADVVVRLLLIYLIQVIPGDKLIIWSILSLIVSAGYASVNIMYCRIKFEEVKIKLHRDMALYRNMLSYAWWDLIGNISVLLQAEGINLMLNMFFGPILNAARGIAFQIQGMLSQFTGGFMTASKPQITKLYAAGEIPQMIRLFFLTTKAAFYLSFIFMLPAAIEIDFVLKIWLGNFPPHTPIFAILTMVNGLIVSMKTPRITAIHATGHIKATNLTVGIILCAIFPIGYLLLKLGVNVNWVFVAIPIITFVSEIVAIQILARYIPFSKRKYWIEVYGRCVLVAIVSSILPLILHFSMSESLLRVILVCTVSFSTVCVAGLYLGFNNAQREILTNKFKDIVKSRILVLFRRVPQ